MELYKEISYGFEKKFRSALEEFPKEFSDYNDVATAFIDYNPNEDSLLVFKPITIPIVFHVVFDRVENDISFVAIKRMLSELNSIYSKYKINFELATHSEKGEKLREPGVARHDWINKSWTSRRGQTRFYRNWGVAISPTSKENIFLDTEDLKKQLGWSPREYFNVYLVNVIRGENSLKYSDTVNSVTSEITENLNSFGIVIPFYALPQEDLQYVYEEQPSEDDYESFQGVYSHVDIDDVSKGNIPSLYDLEPINTDKGDYISLIHSVALSFNLLSLFHNKFQKSEWIDSCLDKNGSCGYNGNMYSGDCCADTPHLKASEYLQFKKDSIINLSCSQDDKNIYTGQNLMAHPYFLEDKLGENLDVFDTKNIRLTEGQIRRIRVNFFLFTDGQPSLWNSLANSIKITTQNIDDRIGCTDPLALNYNPFAAVDNGSCVYDIDFIEENDQDTTEDENVVLEDPCESFFVDSKSSLTNLSSILNTIKNNVYLKTGLPLSDSLLESANKFKRIQKAINSIL